MSKRTADLLEGKIPRVVHSHDVHLDSDYVSWIQDVKKRFRDDRIKAVVKVNSEQLLFNSMHPMSVSKNCNNLLQNWEKYLR